MQFNQRGCSFSQPLVPILKPYDKQMCYLFKDPPTYVLTYTEIICLEHECVSDMVFPEKSIIIRLKSASPPSPSLKSMNL